MAQRLCKYITPAIKHFCFLILSIFTLIYATAQQSAIDSLKRALTTATDDSVRFRLLLQASELYAFSNTDSSIIYTKKAIAVVLLVIAILLWRNIRHRQKAYILLQEQKDKTDKALQKLKATQAQLIQSEKMATLGELTAGIAHEIQNPLNFINNFSESNVDLMDELVHEAQVGNYSIVVEVAKDIKENEKKIMQHGKRAEAIVRSMLEHSHSTKGEKQPTDINAFTDEYLRLNYYGLQAKDKTFNADFKTDFNPHLGKIHVVPQDMGCLLLNLFNNAFYAVHEKAKKLGEAYKPTVRVSTKRLDHEIEIVVKDNGMGISKSIVDKIFQPFFTTKSTGEGTGLGLSLTYDIIKAHGGELKVESTVGEGASFIIVLPANVTS